MIDLDRERERRLAVQPSPARLSLDGSPAFVGQVATVTPNIKAGKFLMATPQLVGGTETEGSAGTFAAPGSTQIPVLLIGPKTPVQGDYVICQWADYRWVTEYTGKGQQQSGCCNCIPTVLTLNSDLSVGESSSIGLGGWFSDAESALTFTYGPSPVRSIGVVATGGFDPAGNVFTYTETPDQGWWTEQKTRTVGTNTYTYWYWMMISGCGISIVLIETGGPVYPTFATMVGAGGHYFCTLLHSTVTLDAVFVSGGYVDTFAEISAAVPKDCDGFNVPFWSFESVILGTVPPEITTISTDTLDLVSDGGYYNSYYGDCVPTGDIENGTSHNITDLQS
ncbi:MAG: hypothetical protein P4L84_34960 [Isosphaeraceae bacterium]|nr:hypothetical protein [Isosphaeraceae bacterium]